MQPKIQVIGTEWHTDYGRGEATTCRVILKNLSNFAGAVYAQVYFGYRSWMRWYDGSSRDWVRFDLPAGGQITRDGHPVVKSDCPYGTMIGQVDVFPQQSRDNMLASAGAPGAVNIVKGVEPEVHELVWLPDTAVAQWDLDRYYDISWARIKVTISSVRGDSPRVRMWLGETEVWNWTGGFYPGSTMDHVLSPFSPPMRANYVRVSTWQCRIKDVHVWFKEAGSASQTQALLSRSYL